MKPGRELAMHGFLAAGRNWARTLMATMARVLDPDPGPTPAQPQTLVLAMALGRTRDASRVVGQAVGRALALALAVTLALAFSTFASQVHAELSPNFDSKPLAPFTSHPITVADAHTTVTPSPAPDENPTRCHHPEVFRVAVIPQRATQNGLQHYDPLLVALADELDTHVEIMPASSYGAVIQGVVDGSIHLAEMGPGSYVQARRRGAKISPFASLHSHAQAKAPASYYAVLITRHDSDFHSLGDTRGATVSLVDPNSTSGALVPRQMLPQLTGHTLEEWFKRISYAGSHDHAIRAVLRGHVDTAFVSSHHLHEVQYQGRPAAHALRTLWRSAPLPVDPYVYQDSLCYATKVAIHRVFFRRSHEFQSFFQWRQQQAFMPVSEKDYQALIP